MSPFVQKALSYLNDTVNKSALHSMDEDRVKVVLRVLHEQNEKIDLYNLNVWLEENKWGPEPTKFLVNLSKAVAAGKRVRLRHKEMAPSKKEILDNIAKRLE